MGAAGAWTPESMTTKGLTSPKTAEDAALIEDMLQFKPNMMWLLEQTRGFTLTDHDSTAIVELLEYEFYFFERQPE